MDYMITQSGVLIGATHSGPPSERARAPPWQTAESEQRPERDAAEAPAAPLQSGRLYRPRGHARCGRAGGGRAETVVAAASGREAAAVRVGRQPRLTLDDHSRPVATESACGVAARLPR